MSERDEIKIAIFSGMWLNSDPPDAGNVYDALAALFAEKPWLANALLPEEWKAVPAWPTQKMAREFVFFSSGIEEMGNGSLERYGTREEDVYIAWQQAIKAAPSGLERPEEQQDAQEQG